MTIRLSCLSDIIPALMAEAKANPNIQELMRAICSVVPEERAGYSYREHIDFVTRNKTETVELRIDLEREALEEFELLDLSGEIKLQVKTPINYLSSKAYAFVVAMRPYSTKSIEIRSRELRKYLDWFVSQVERHHATSIESFEKWVEAHPYQSKEPNYGWPLLLFCLFVPISFGILWTYLPVWLVLLLWPLVLAYPYHYVTERLF